MLTVSNIPLFPSQGNRNEVNAWILKGFTKLVLDIVCHLQVKGVMWRIHHLFFFPRQKIEPNYEDTKGRADRTNWSLQAKQTASESLHNSESKHLLQASGTSWIPARSGHVELFMHLVINNALPAYI